MSPTDWVLVVSTGIGGVFGLFCLFDGARRIALSGSNSASGYLIGLGTLICLALAGYAYWKYGEQGGAQVHFVEFVMWLVWGAAALVFGALFARKPAPESAWQDTKPEPAWQDTRPEPALAPPVASQAPQPAVAAAPSAPPKPAVGEDTVPLPKPVVGEDTVPLPKPAIPAKPSMGEDTVPLPKPQPGAFKPPQKKP